uniref:ABC transporter D family member 1 n=1 Tax=Lygus hesperus TaxID=30085 RepID=A0A0A9YJ99_LYGHE
MNLLVADDSTAAQARQIMRLLYNMEKDLSLEHLANKSIPALSPLLLNRSMEIRNYAVRSIEEIIAKFDPSVLKSNVTTVVMTSNDGNINNTSGNTNTIQPP